MGIAMNRSRRRSRKLPVEPIELTIDRLSHDGRGVSRIEGKVAFVDGALPGEKVLATYKRSRSKLAELTTQSVMTTASDRVEPPCQFAGTCGGCSLQHLDAGAQIEFKQSVLLEQLQHAAGLSADAITILPSLVTESLHYRRKARLAVRFVKNKGGVLVGFREKYSSFITDMDNCSVLVSEVAELIKPLRDLISQLLVRNQIAQVEVAVGETVSGGNKIALVIRHLQALPEQDESALTSFAAMHAIEMYLQPGDLTSVHKIWPQDSEPRLQYFLPDFDLVMHFHPMDFTQINAGINRQMIPLALRLLDLQADDVVLDLFCGLGNFTLPIARNCRQVLGIEGSEEMVARATENAGINEVQNVEFLAANLAKPIAEQPWINKGFNKILLDPPRSGALEIIDQVAALAASKIVYISCNPATLARDTALLLANGYQLKKAGVMDMFPHTAHVESIAEFELTKR